jgi:uncharacterized protein (DUF2267 family)
VDSVQFIDLVRQRAGVPSSRRLDGMPLTDTEMAEALTRATLQVLSQRISGGQARDLADELSSEFEEWLRPEHERAEPFDLEVFIQRVADRALVDFEDVLAQLSRDYTAFLDESE